MNRSPGRARRGSLDHKKQRGEGADGRVHALARCESCERLSSLRRSVRLRRYRNCSMQSQNTVARFTVNPPALLPCHVGPAQLSFGYQYKTGQFFLATLAPKRFIQYWGRVNGATSFALPPAHYSTDHRPPSGRRRHRKSG